MNRVTLVGNVGKDPESKSFTNGGKVVNLSIATAETWKDKTTGERKEKTEWHNVSIFQDGLTGIVEQYVRKGSRILVEGKLQTRKWQDQSGNDRYSTEVVLQGPDARIILLDGKPSGDNARGSTREQAEQREGPGKSKFADDLDDDVPF
jgi:single-strand DNA-binding protein